MFHLITRWILMNKYKSVSNQVECTWTGCLQTEIAKHIVRNCYLLNREIKTSGDQWCKVPCLVLWIISVYIRSCGNLIPWKVFVVFLRHSKNAEITYETLHNLLEGHGSNYRLFHWKFFIDIFFPAALWFWGRFSL
jgi:hypothetical protein